MVRDLFHHRIEKGMLGPGSENWGLNDDEEIISDYPLVRYFTGVLFPEKDNPRSESDADEDLGKSETEEPNGLTINSEVEERPDNETDKKIKDESDSEIENKANQNHFNPNNIGLTFCLDKLITTIDVVFSGGFYYEPKQDEVKIKMPPAGYEAFSDIKLGFPFRELLIYEEGYLSLTRELKGDKGGKNIRSGDYLLFDDFKKSDGYKDSSVKYYINYFEKLIGRVWKRKNFSYSVTIKIEDTSAPINIPIPENEHITSIGYNVKTYQVKEYKYIKVQLINLSKQSSKRFTNKTPELNQKCLFQSSIQISSTQILPFKSNQELNPFDQEAQELNLLYRNVKSYGIGHNCSVIWDEELYRIQTTFLPEYNIKDTKNDFQESDFSNHLDFEKLDNSLSISGEFADIDHLIPAQTDHRFRGKLTT
jgi:hypothetical protein